MRFMNTATNTTSDPGSRRASGTPPSAVPPVSPTVGVPQQREARTGAPPRRGTPFVARRAVNLHGCALPHFAPRSPYSGGTPAARSSYLGAPLLRRLRRTLPSLAPSVRFTAVKKGLSLFAAVLLTGGVLFTQG